MDRIDEIIKSASEQVKGILLEGARKFEDFPTTMIGVRDKKYVDNVFQQHKDLYNEVSAIQKKKKILLKTILVQRKSQQSFLFVNRKKYEFLDQNPKEF